MNYKEFTNKQLANELQYMPYIDDMAPSEFDLIQTVIGRLKISVIQIPPHRKKKTRPKCKDKSTQKKNS